MGSVKSLLLRLCGDKPAAKPVDADDTDSSSAPRLQQPERYADWGGGSDMIMRADVTGTTVGDLWPGSRSPSPVQPHMSRRQAREWERLRAQDAEREREQGSQ